MKNPSKYGSRRAKSLACALVGEAREKSYAASLLHRSGPLAAESDLAAQVAAVLTVQVAAD